MFIVHMTNRVDIWRDRRSCKILVSRVNLSANNVNCAENLPKNKEIVLCLSKLMILLPFNCVMFVQS